MKNFDTSNKIDDTNINMKYNPNKVTLGAKSIVLFKAMRLDPSVEALCQMVDNYYIKNAKANFLDTVLNDNVKVINIDAMHNVLAFDNIVAQITNKILK